MSDMNGGLRPLLDSYLALAQEYKDLTYKQAQAIEDEDVEALKVCIDQRAKLIETIDAQSAKIKVIAEQAGYSEPDVAETLAQVKKIFETVRLLDTKNITAIKSMMMTISEEGKKVSKSREGIGKYGQKDMHVSPGYINKLQ